MSAKDDKSLMRAIMNPTWDKILTLNLVTLKLLGLLTWSWWRVFVPFAIIDIAALCVLGIRFVVWTGRRKEESR